jgi:transcriptional regulator with XRE-family HTH domain
MSVPPTPLPRRLTQPRKARGLSQQRFADLAGLHVNQIKRYEAGTAQPTLDALVNLAQALHVSLDNMVFDEGGAGAARRTAPTVRGDQPVHARGKGGRTNRPRIAYPQAYRE